MRKFMYAVLVLLVVQVSLAGEIVWQEDFESAGYVIDAQVDASNPTEWILGGINYPAGFTCPDGSTLDPPVMGRWARICAPKTGAIGGTKAAEFVDINTVTIAPAGSAAGNETEWGIKAGMFPPEMMDYNGGNGIQKGYVQWDWFYFTGGVGVGTGTGAHVNFALFDEYPVTEAATTPKAAFNPLRTLCRTNFNQGGAGMTSPLQFMHGTPTPVAQLGLNPWVREVTYRTRVTFDLTVEPKVMSCQVWSGAPDFATLNFDSNVPATLNATTPQGNVPICGDANFKGVRGFFIWCLEQANRNPAIEVDNIIAWSDISAGPSPEVAVTVDAADVADGGSVNFGAPAVGVPTSKTFTVSNTGTADLTTANLVLPAGYTLAAGSDLAATITPASSDDFIVELDTATEGIKGGEITFDTNDSDENPFNITVTANVGSTSVEEWTER